jgi:succinate-semialdehyde dehydrogenase/glutarate-semialdehyde dehydrogenase
VSVSIASINPATGETLRSYEPHDGDEVERRIGLAAQAFRRHRRTSFAERTRMMLRAAEILDAEREEFARLMVTEMGKPIQAARDEAAKSALGCRYYAEHAERFLADERVETHAKESWVAFQPLGPVLAIMPWNFPFWQVFRFAAPALMAGNVGLLKHASNVPQTALFMAELFTRAGSAVAAAAGKAIKKSVLELGGSDPFIVMPSAYLETAARTAVTARAVNNGQSCIAAKRFIVAEAVGDEFERRFVGGMAALTVGDPMDPGVAVGPLANEAQLRTLTDQVERTVAAGAKVLTGGGRVDRQGYFYQPTVLTGITPDSPAWREEFFGPVALLFRVPSADEAIRLANDSPFGLGASVWTRDAAERARFVAELEAGMVFVNAMVASDPKVPFGGVKHSGYGRELGPFGIREFVNIKTVWVGG